jgi:hypothetical protein
MAIKILHKRNDQLRESSFVPLYWWTCRVGREDLALNNFLTILIIDGYI